MKPIPRSLLTGLALALVLSQAAWAEPASTLAAAVDAAWRRSAASAESAGQARRALAQRTAASAWWPSSPAIEIGVTRDRQRANGTSRETEVGFAVPLWLPGQRGARLDEASADAAAASAFAAVARWRVAGAVREAAADVAVQRAELDTAQLHSRELDALAKDVERRVAAGELARADTLAADAERLAAAGAVLQSRQRLQTAQLQWRALTGLDVVPALRSGDATAAGTAEAHPALAAAARNVELARRRVEVANASRRDAPELIVRARQEVASGEPDTNGVGVALRIPFGTAARNQPLQAAALSELELAEAAERELQQRIEADIEAARLAETSARQQLEDEDTRAQLLRERASLIRKSFDAGETALPDMLRALTAAAHAESSFTRQQAALAQAASRLQQALGVMP